MRQAACSTLLPCAARDTAQPEAPQAPAANAAAARHRAATPLCHFPLKARVRHCNCAWIDRRRTQRWAKGTVGQIIIGITAADRPRGRARFGASRRRSASGPVGGRDPANPATEPQHTWLRRRWHLDGVVAQHRRRGRPARNVRRHTHQLHSQRVTFEVTKQIIQASLARVFASTRQVSAAE